MRDVLRQGSHQIEHEEGMDPATRAELLLTLGDVQVGLGWHDEAGREFERAEDVLDEHPGPVGRSARTTLAGARRAGGLAQGLRGAARGAGPHAGGASARRFSGGTAASPAHVGRVRQRPCQRRPARGHGRRDPTGRNADGDDGRPAARRAGRAAGRSREPRLQPGRSRSRLLGGARQPGNRSPDGQRTDGQRGHDTVESRGHRRPARAARRSAGPRPRRARRGPAGLSGESSTHRSAPAIRWATRSDNAAASKRRWPCSTMQLQHRIGPAWRSSAR